MLKVWYQSFIAIVCLFAIGNACASAIASEPAAQPATQTEPPPAGVGMVVILEKGRFWVEVVLPDMPAARANVQAGDAILAVDGVAAENYKTVDEMVAKIRGKSGSHVKLKLQTGDKVREITLVRGAIPSMNSLKSQVPGDFGREVSVYFYQFEDLVPDVEPGRYTFMNQDYSVGAFLRSQLNGAKLHSH